MSEGHAHPALPVAIPHTDRTQRCFPSLCMQWTVFSNGDWRCLHCLKTFKKFGVSRAREHLVPSTTSRDVALCTKAPRATQALVKEEHDRNEAETSASKRARRDHVPAFQPIQTATPSESLHPTSESSSAISSHPAPKPPALFFGAGSLHRGQLQQIHHELALFFLGRNISFNAVEDIHLANALKIASGQGSTSLRLPSRRQLAGEILDDVHTAATQAATIQFAAATKLTGCTLATDGWSTRNNLGFVNYIMVGQGLSLFHSCTWESPSKRAGDVAAEAARVIEEFGRERIVQVCIDGADRAAMDLLQQQFPEIFFTWCAAHSLDMLIEDICKHEEIDAIVKTSRELISFVMEHQSLLAEFRLHSNSRNLLRPGATRFATHFIAMSRMWKERAAILAMFASDAYKTWLSGQRGDARARANTLETTCGIIIWFKRVENVMKLMEVIVMLLRKVDGAQPGMAGKIHYELYLLQEKFKDDSEESLVAPFSHDCRMHIRSALATRWQKMHSEIYTAGYILDPEFQDEKTFQQNSAENMRLWKKLVRRLYPDDADFAQIMDELHLYQDQLGSFADGVNSPLKKQAAAYWRTFGEDAPRLQRLAIRIFSQPISASACERNWSLYSWILGQRRHRLLPEKLNKLVAIRMHELTAENARSTTPGEDAISWITEEIDEDEEATAMLLTVIATPADE